MLITTHQNLTEVAKVVKDDIINALVPYDVMTKNQSKYMCNSAYNVEYFSVCLFTLAVLLLLVQYVLFGDLHLRQEVRSSVVIRSDCQNVTSSFSH